MDITDYVKQTVDPSLEVGGPVLEDNSIESYDLMTVLPTASSSIDNPVGDLRFDINQSDQYLHLHKAFLHLRIQALNITNPNNKIPISAARENSDNVAGDNAVAGKYLGAPTHNAWAHLFSDVRWEINSQPIQRYHEFSTINTMHRTILSTTDTNDYGLDSGAFCLESGSRLGGDGVVTSIKSGINLISDTINNNVPPVEPLSTLINKGFQKRRQYFTRFADTAAERGTMDFQIPLSEIFTFHRDYKQVIFGMSHALVMTFAEMTNAVKNFFQFNNDPTNPAIWVPGIKFEYAALMVPTVRPSLVMQEKFNRMILDKVEYPISFRGMRVSTFSVPDTSDFSWNAASVSISSEQPLWCVIGFQNVFRDNKFNYTKSMFDNLNVTDISAYANGAKLPLQTRNYNRDKFGFSRPYNEFQSFKHDFDGYDKTSRSAVDQFDYTQLYPLYVIDLNRIPEQRRNGVVNISIQARLGSNAPAGTRAYMLLYTKSVMTAVSDGTRLNLVRQ